MEASKIKPVYACVMARGGSKRIPRKNLQPFCGLPLMEWTLLQARQAKMIDATYLVSDDEEIHELGAKYGVRPVWQTHEECEAGVNGGNIAMTRFYQALIEDGRQDSVSCTLMPTSPLRPPGMIDDVLRVYFEVCLPVEQWGFGCQAEISHPGFSYEISPGRSVILSSPTQKNFLSYTMLVCVGMTQVNLRLYDGEVTVERGLEIVHRNIPTLTPPQYFYKVEPWQCHDIDQWYEFHIAEVAMERMLLKGRGKNVYAVD